MSDVNLQEPCHELSSINHVIAVMSGKGGVGKSSVAALLASGLARQGMSVGVLDADITGPSIPRLFGLTGRAESCELGLFPMKTKQGVKVMSLNLLIEQEDQPVIWRGPLIGGAIKQFWQEVIWGSLDYLIVDLPPGTGDAPLTVMQVLPVQGLVIVSSPQDLAVMVVKKAVNMARSMQVPIVGLIENMSGMLCPHCQEWTHPFGLPQGNKVSEELGLPFLGNLPIDPNLRELCDAGKVEDYVSTEVDLLVDIIRRR